MNIPSSLATSNSSLSDVSRTALIAAAVLVAIALGAVFISKGAQKRRIGFIETIECIRREGKGVGAVGLPDDDSEDTTHQWRGDLPSTPTSIPRSMRPPSPPHSGPSIYSTASFVRGDSGSMFREEFWSPVRGASRHLPSRCPRRQSGDIGQGATNTNCSNGLSYPGFSPNQHPRNIFGYSCAICRIDCPHINYYPTLAKHAVRSPALGIVGTFPDHDGHNTSY
ncbi:hypothetical protein IW261DRAFT_831123 [Armillaria novae-zelandiae]|uniref:Uncharacterized protein n=1 Tax=Armillaria novae-zelandiae TaxID=153914 RepID=A0AA39NU34_9AGAR|nr:hypothetical protein IW261DRAFT_831123 [Armillaria novae-zelandiae]